MMTSVQSAGVEAEVNLRITQVRKHTNEGSTLALKPGLDVSRSSKQGYQWPDKRTFFLQNKKKLLSRPGMEPNGSYSPPEEVTD